MASVLESLIGMRIAKRPACRDAKTSEPLLLEIGTIRRLRTTMTQAHNDAAAKHKMPSKHQSIVSPVRNMQASNIVAVTAK